MSFDRIKHTTGLLHKIKFYIVYGKMFFLIDSFLSSRRLCLKVQVPLTLKCVGIPSLLFFFNYRFDDILRKIAIWVDDTALN